MEEESPTQGNKKDSQNTKMERKRPTPLQGKNQKRKKERKIICKSNQVGNKKERIGN